MCYPVYVYEKKLDWIIAQYILTENERNPSPLSTVNLASSEDALYPKLNMDNIQLLGATTLTAGLSMYCTRHAWITVLVNILYSDTRSFLSLLHILQKSEPTGTLENPMNHENIHICIYIYIKN